MFETTFLVNLLEILPHYSSLIAFIATLLTGENGTLFVAFLSAQGFFNIWLVITFSFLAMIFLDSFWFFFAKTKYIDKFKNWNKISSNYKKMEEHVQRITNNNDALLLLVAKVLIGTRILIILYLSSKRLTFWKFTKYNTGPTLLWVSALGTIGWLAGKGFEKIWIIFKDIQLAILFLMIITVLYYIIMRLINRWLMKRRKQLI